MCVQKLGRRGLVVRDRRAERVEGATERARFRVRGQEPLPVRVVRHTHARQAVFVRSSVHTVESVES